jgi:hypothetical protein
MGQPKLPLKPEAVFKSTLLDPAGQPNLVFSQPNRLNWTLTNNSEEDDLVLHPFESGSASQTQYHFLFNFARGALQAVPNIPGWSVAADPPDAQGAIRTLYLAATNLTTIRPQKSNVVELNYTTAIQEDPNNSHLAVTITAGKNVTLGGAPIEGTIYGPFDLTLVPAPAPALSVAPISVDFVGRRTVLNDGVTGNYFTFALTNITSADLVLTPQSETNDGPSPSVITVWFDAAPNDQKAYPWALARVQHLDATSVRLTPTPPSSDWIVTKSISAYMALASGNPQWSLTVSRPVTLVKQLPLLFTFTGIVSDLDPGFTRMYLKFENLGPFAPGVLVAELEKSPLLYGSTRGQGLYLSAGTPLANTPPALNYDSALYVNQFGNASAATFIGKVAIGTPDPKNQLHIGSGESTITNDRVSVVIATKGTDTGIAIAQEGGALGPVNLLVQASGAGAYIGTTSNHPLVLRTGDADRVSVDKDGNLHVGSDKSSDAGITIVQKDGVNALLQVSNTGGYLGTTSSHQLILGTNDKDRLIVDADGNVGIGDGNLHVGSDQSSDAGITIVQKDGVNALLQVSNAGGYLGTTSNHQFILRTNDKDRLVVDADGNVGIGPAAPNFPKFPLHMPVGKALRIEGGTDDTVNYFSFGGNGTFGVDAPNVPNGRFVILNSGNVGIGTPSPDAKLSIRGGLHVGGDSDPGDKNLLVDGTLTVGGPITEKLDVIQGCYDNWGDPNHPVQKYFRERLKGKPPGTMLRAIGDDPNWRAYYFSGWVNAQGHIWARIISTGDDHQIS